MGINKIVDIEKILEAISLEFVLADNTDPESFSDILPLLKELFETAKKQNLPEIAEEALRAGKILKNFLNNSVSALTEEVDLLGNIISEMKSFVPMFSESLNETKEKQTPSVNDIFHPGELPSCLNMNDFSEFLDAQTQNLEQMERLILDIEKNKNTNALFRELKGLLHTMKGESGFLNLKDVENICHITEDLIETNASNEIADILLTVKDWLQSTFAVYAGLPEQPEDINTIISIFKKFNNKAVKNKETNSCRAKESPQDTIPPDKNPSASPVTIMESTNVDASRLDRMIDTIGEFAIAESMIFQSDEIEQFASAELMRSITLLHKITKELQRIGVSLRMIPLKSLFYKMERVIRDLSKKTEKKIQIVIKGEATEVDKNIVDKLKDPLIHLIRNCVDHGIEKDPNQRIQARKPETATIELKAFHKGSNLLIEVTDDGTGIDKDKLLNQAIAKGLVSDQEILSDREIFNLIFHPGLSTSDKVTDVSGRGVGMDVVKKSIQACNGKVSVKSKTGFGTTCTITIPLTLSMIDGLVVRVGEERYIVPTLSVVTSLKPDKNMLSCAFEKGEMLNALGRLIPIIRIHNIFDVKETVKDPCMAIIVVVEDNDRKAGLLVDQVLGKQNTVIKKLGGGMEDIKGISGGTIMPDGKVSLILDIAALIDNTYTGKQGL